MEEGVELEAAAEGLEGGAVGLDEAEVVKGEAEGGVAADFGEPAGEAALFGVFGDGAAGLAGNFGGVGDDLLDRAVLGEEFYIFVFVFTF